MYKIKLKIRGLSSINSLHNFIKTNNIRLILFGEYHGFINQIQVQKEIIKKAQPDFFLYEMLEETKIQNNKDVKKFLNIPNEKEFSVISNYGDLKPIIKLAKSFDLPIIGCDIKNMEVKKDWKKRTFSAKEKKDITRKRELKQAKIINEYASKGLVFALIGEYHLRKESIMLSSLKDKKAIIIKPDFRWEERFSNKKKFNSSEISYTIRLKE